jgi:starvation-inducible DNA-binding protein
MDKHLGTVHHLGVLLSNTILLSMKALNFHWHVTGPHFSQYHALFQQHYTELGSVSDLLAERIRTLGHKAPGSLQEVLNHATLIEVKETLSAVAMIQSLHADYKAMALDIHQALKDISEDDAATKMLLEDLLGAVEKNVWLLGSHLA